MKSTVKSRKFVWMAAIALSFLGGICVAGAAADAISVKQARELLQHLAGANLSRNQVQIKKVEAGIGGGAIVEAQIETAFRVKKEKGGWEIAEVRLGDRQWESFELIEEAIKREKTRRTTALLMQLAEGLTAYQKERGQFADTDEIEELLDFLSPRYLSSAPRFDLWGKEFEYKGSSSKYRLSSAGPDGKRHTKDDLVIENGTLKISTE
jgi:hypothetical protein